jgi:hypothetical protein
MPGLEARNGHRPKLNVLPDGGVEVPDGFVQLSDDLLRYNISGAHRYLHLPTLTWCKGLTTILKNMPMDEGLMRYVANQGGYDQYRENLSKAGKRGTRVHLSIGDLLDGKTIRRRQFTDEEWNHLCTWVQFFKDHLLDTFAIEQPIVDTRRKVATCIDWRGDFNGVHTSVNWKTSSAIYESACVQANEEAWIYNDAGQFDELGPVEKWAVVRTGTRHKCGYEIVAEPLDKAKHEYFNHLLAIDEYHDPNGIPIFPKELPDTLKLPDSPPLNGKPH